MSHRPAARAAPAALLLLALAAAPARAAAPAARPLDLRPAAPAGHGGETRCDRCHTTDRWGDVAFAHERTGFPLVGEHRKAGCKQCHPVSFDRPLSHACDACHRDVHRGSLGSRCQGCHDEQSWRSRFDADAHRRAGFPLTGRHAFVACEECHGNQLNRGFARSVKQCGDCHSGDLARANAVVPHTGFGTDCKACHTPWRFANAFFPAHEQCFAIATGKHAGIACLRCHTGGIPLVADVNSLSCTSYLTNPPNCQSCHDCGSHPAVLGFACSNPKCYECHRFATTTGALRGARSIR